VETEDLGQPLDLGGGGLVQADPDERVGHGAVLVVLTHQADGLGDAAGGHLLACDVRAELDE
jgi:hypothetical protein